MLRRIACFAMSDRNHFGGVLPVVAELVRAGAEVRFWTDRAFRADVERAGAEFADIFDSVSLDEVDDSSRPLPSRYVTFAAARGKALAALAASWGATLVLHDGFALVGRVVGEQLGVPWVTVLPGESMQGPAARAALANDPRLQLDPRCLAAAEILRDSFGIADASPLSYLGDPSPWLNIHKQPPQWLSEEERAALMPVASFGCLGDARFPPARAPSSRLRVYASFGTIVWRYWSQQALAGLTAIADAAERTGGIDLTIGLGGSAADGARLVRPHVRVLPYAEQRELLAETDLFITHQGVNSTHEAIAALTPMLSLPFFADQPAMTARAHELGVALPLAPEASGTKGDLTADQVMRAFQRFFAARDEMQERLRIARGWEQEVIAARPLVAQKILAL